MAHATSLLGFFDVFDVGPCHEALLEQFTHKELRRLQRDVGSAELRELIGAYLERYPIRAADIAAGEHVVLLQHFATVPGLRLELPPATYWLVRGDEGNAAHLLNEPRTLIRSAGDQKDGLSTTRGIHSGGWSTGRWSSRRA